MKTKTSTHQNGAFFPRRRASMKTATAIATRTSRTMATVAISAGETFPRKCTRLLRHRRSPVVLVEERHLVLLRHVRQQAGDVGGRSEFPAPVALVSLEE